MYVRVRHRPLDPPAPGAASYEHTEGKKRREGLIRGSDRGSDRDIEIKRATGDTGERKESLEREKVLEREESLERVRGVTVDGPRSWGLFSTPTASVAAGASIVVVAIVGIIVSIVLLVITTVVGIT